MDTVLLEDDLGPNFSGVGVVTKRNIHVYGLPAQELIDKTLARFLPTLREPLFGSSEVPTPEDIVPTGGKAMMRQAFAFLF